MILQILAAALLSTEATPSRPTLSGVIRTIDGEPIEGGLVFIYTARPRQGSSTTCPSCYLDCRRRARTGGNGAFEIAGVDPSLLFRVGVAADGYVASFQEDVDPTAGPISVSLTPEPALPTNPRRVLRGRVVEPHGSPVVGALIEPIG
ncbi:MAG: carboxypeptidase regulatory-like domain-containing protein, partial [Acidobacteria bacterium]